MNRSDALWELIGDHLVELVRLRKQDHAVRVYLGRLITEFPKSDVPAHVIEELDRILFKGQK